ncbi:MAG: glycosyltransferase [Alphaproteobacteria bacterium]|jgi:predicted glycosyltransferase|nr:glycosyltransferase [Alphaproteobacteria bacterium]
MADWLNGARLLIYSHDTFGLGHLRRCQSIAHALVERYKGLSVLILSGSPIIGSFDFRARVDFVRIPGVIKLYNGEYTSLGLHIDLKETMAIRASIIHHTAQTFAPDLFLVDKEPLGLKGEIHDTLTMLKSRGTQLVLGLRDIMDEPTLLRREWRSKNLMPALDELYDDIWVFGLEEIWDPLTDLDVSPAVRDKMVYTGYLPRQVPKHSKALSPVEMDEPYLLVTAGGGGDGDAMMDWTMRAYEADPELPYPAVFVLGPFMRSEMQNELMERGARLDRVEVVAFDSHMELLMKKSSGVVAMGGYNTFCEIISLDKRALIIPRSHPRQEQLIRARRADELGLVRMLTDDSISDPQVMIDALRALPAQRLPSEAKIPNLLGGQAKVGDLAGQSLRQRKGPELVVLQGQN